MVPSLPMTNEQAKKLVLALLKADSEAEVIELLKTADMDATVEADEPECLEALEAAQKIAVGK